MSSNAEGVGLQIFFFHHFESGEAGGAGDGVAAESAEKFHSVGEAFRNFWRGDDGSERKPVGDGFSQDDDVRDGVLRFEAPEVGTEAAEGDLHFVGDADGAGGADVGEGVR